MSEHFEFLPSEQLENPDIRIWLKEPFELMTAFKAFTGTGVKIQTNLHLKMNKRYKEPMTEVKLFQLANLFTRQIEEMEKGLKDDINNDAIDESFEEYIIGGMADILINWVFLIKPKWCYWTDHEHKAPIAPLTAKSAQPKPSLAKFSARSIEGFISSSITFMSQQPYLEGMTLKELPNGADQDIRIFEARDDEEEGVKVTFETLYED